MATRARSSAIVWQNHAQTVTLIDVPYSIAAAQGQDRSGSYHLLSTPPLEATFPSNEPKSAAAKAKLHADTVKTGIYLTYGDALRKALDEIHVDYHGKWCLPRHFVEETANSSSKRKADTSLDNTNTSLDHKDSLPEIRHGKLSDRLLNGTGRNQNEGLVFTMQYPREDREPYEGNGSWETKQHFFHNDKGRSTTFSISCSNSSDAVAFNIPPKTSFFLKDCADSRSFHACIRNQAQQDDTRKTFDLILLDPPWPNRSVKRTHQTPGSTYNTISTLWDVRNLLLDMDLDILMAEDCLVAKWITNKPAVRDLVLGENGIFECWGVELVEEWLWLKTTVHGEPVTPLDALWRKPYEILLLGRKRRGRVDITNAPTPAELPRRVIFSVPDLHSRKPCLKELIEPLMQDRDDYRALEVFTRHLVAGWWSWGNECIKFNWQGYWRGATKDEVEDDHVET